MASIWEWAGPFVGGLVGVGGGLVAAAWLTKRILDHWLQRALAEGKARLDEQAEARRGEFTRELERGRASAARDLEAFKSELTLASEVRRQVAAHKVAALLEIVREGEPLERLFLGASPHDPKARAEAVTKLHVYFSKVRSSAFLFPHPVAVQLSDYASSVIRLTTAWSQSVDVEALTKLSGLYREYLDLVRKELGVEERT